MCWGGFDSHGLGSMRRGDFAGCAAGAGERRALSYDARLGTESFRHKGRRRFYETGSVAGIEPKHATGLRMQLAALDSVQVIEGMDIPGFRLHPLKGAGRGRR